MNTKPKTLRPLLPNRHVERAYRDALLKMVDQMHASVSYWVTVKYKNNEPVMAQDATPAQVLNAAIRKLTARWRKNFNVMSKELAAYFAKSVSKRTDAQLKSILKRGGFTVKLQHTAAQKDIIQSTIHQNVSLIKSIPEKYLSDVEQMVMRSVQTGRDLKTLTEELEKKYKTTRRRAELIARDQNNKATASLERARQVELGITEAVWVHSHAGKVPRRTHVKMDGKKYDTSKGMWDSDEQEWIFPGQLINCRCFSRAVIPGLT